MATELRQRMYLAVMAYGIREGQQLMTSAQALGARLIRSTARSQPACRPSIGDVPTSPTANESDAADSEVCPHALVEFPLNPAQVCSGSGCKSSTMPGPLRSLAEGRHHPQSSSQLSASVECVSLE